MKIIDYKLVEPALTWRSITLQLVSPWSIGRSDSELEERKHPGKEVSSAGIFDYIISGTQLVDTDKENAETPEEIEKEILRQLLHEWSGKQ